MSKRLALGLLAATTLGGCAVYGPYDPYGSYGYPAYPAAVYAEPAPVYVGPPAYFNFSYRSGHGHGHRHGHYGRGYRGGWRR